MNPRLDGVSADVVRHTRLLLLDTLGEGLGFRWEITNSYFKPYPCARWIHPALDALSRVLAEVPRPADTIAELSVETFAFVASLDDPDPSFDLHARFSGPYCAAALAYDGLLDAGSFPAREAGARGGTGARPRRPAHRGGGAHDGPAAPGPTRVTLRRANGRRASAEVANARGNPDTPLSEAEIVHKFRRNAGDRVTPDVADGAVASLLSPRADRPARAHHSGETADRCSGGLMEFLVHVEINWPPEADPKLKEEIFAEELRRGQEVESVGQRALQQRPLDLTTRRASSLGLRPALVRRSQS
jgi:2-methylcitrate dehydratase PrpD